MASSPIAQSIQKKAIIESSLQLTAAISTAEATMQTMVSPPSDTGMTGLFDGLKTTISLLTNALRCQQTLLDTLLRGSLESKDGSSVEDMREAARTEIVQERNSRCIVVANLDESTGKTASERQIQDEGKIGMLLDRLNVQCRPSAVYRVGAPTDNSKGKRGSRYVFVEFPSRSFVLEALRRKVWLRKRPHDNGYDFSQVYVEPPMSKDERKRAYEERSRKREEFKSHGGHDLSGSYATRKRAVSLLNSPRPSTSHTSHQAPNSPLGAQ